ncbi:MAG: hypothetical protein PHI12_14730 [Dehalococcoidales bacterium]|nr:hypothetical protein [Dehalococcoidales bacterium]
MDSRIPAPKTKEAEKLIKAYQVSTREQREEWATRYGYCNLDNFQTAVRKHYGVKVPSSRPSVDLPKVERNPVVNLPPVNLILPKDFKTQKGDEEIAILHVSDGHADKITKSYNKEVYKSRMHKLFISAMKIVALHRNMYPIRKLVVFNTGDNIQGENPHQGSSVADVSMGARDQVTKLAAPVWNDILGSFRQQFQEVEFHGVKGNHGHDKLAPETSSYDLLLYDILAAGMGQKDGISVHVYDDWYAIVDLMGFKHFLFHGYGIPCQQGVPFFALDKKLKAWHMQLGGFRYAWSGHFHKEHYNEVSSVLEHFMCGPLVSDDNWALSKLGISSSPSQGIYGLHPRHGITWRYKLDVD